ncbi:MAG: hypothetical protein JNN03_07615 [Rubrivivax sp.]|nr:hypothetical protein [Rubrivivax sp.]
MGSSNLATIALYLDQKKNVLANRIPGSRQWHYDDRPVCEPEARRADYCADGNCASVQITRHYRKLIDKHSTVDERRFAVQVLVHLVGDVHQPLHASDHDDRGGNDVRVHFALSGGQPRTTDLHSAWDTDFVKAAFATADERKIARDLLTAYSDSIKSWQRGAAAAWLAESCAIARATAYGKLPGFLCSGDDGGDFGVERLELDAAYVAEATSIVPQQLVKARARIAYLLNRAFAK